MSAALLEQAPADRFALDRPAALDEATFRQVWSQLHPRVAGYIATRAPHADVDDLTDEVFLRAWRARRSYRPASGTVHAWVFTIAANLVVDDYRTAARRQRALEQARGARAATTAVDPTDVAEVATDHADTDAEMIRVRHALATLPERQAVVVVARHLLDMPVAEVAIRLRIPHHQGTVKSLCSRGLVALRAALAALPTVLPTATPPLPSVPDRPADPARAALAALTHITFPVTPLIAQGTPRSAHVVHSTRPRRAYGARRRGRRGGAAGPVSTCQQALGRAAPAATGRVEAVDARTASRRPDIPGRRQHAGTSEAVGHAGPRGGAGGPHPSSGQHRTAAGRVMTAADTFAGVVFVLTAAVSAVLIRRALRRRYEADPWRQIDTEALQDIRARRDPQLAAVVGSRATLLAATYDGSEAPPRVIRRAEPVDVGLDRETTVRIPPEDVHVGPPINHPIGHPIAWPEPIPQAIVNHVALWQTTAGRHRLTDGAR